MEKSELKKLKAMLLAGTITANSLLLSGCGDEIIVDDATKKYDVIDTNGEDVKIKNQELEVPGEDFKLIVEYSLDENASKQWKITDSKKICTKIYTKNLDKNTKVYIDNIHTDTTLVASKEAMNGILQDSMDDRIHNSQMIGFPIDNDTYLYSVNQIEGQNDTFIEGATYGMQGVEGGTITQKRYTEENYLEKGVYGNKISSTYGLLIKKGEEEAYGVDVSSDMVVLAYNKVKKIDKKDKSKIKVYTYDRKGNCTESIEEKEDG